MSAVTSHLETGEPEPESEIVCSLPIGALGAGEGVCAANLETAHAQLLSFAWDRLLAEQILAGKSWHIERRQKGKGQDANLDALYIVLDQRLPTDAIPWSYSSSPKGFLGAPIFSSPSKMKCPTFDLPSGYMTLGGSCPGAAVCQSTTPLEERIDQQSYADERRIFLGTTGPTKTSSVSLSETICTSCYAHKARYIYSDAHFRSVLRYAWTRDLLGRNRNAWIDAMCAALSAETFFAENQIDGRTGQPVIPVRLHSSGDFFSPVYAEAWMEIANQFPQICFWAPTRTWAGKGWLWHWPELLKMNRVGNVIVRPSALHFGDYAPTLDGHPWDGPYPFNAAGTTSLRNKGAGRDQLPPDRMGFNFGGEYDGRYDWGCQAYAAHKQAAACLTAINPDGGIGCRTCWVYPQLRVNFAAH